jgi:hypothetical protein
MGFFFLVELRLLLIISPIELSFYIAWMYEADKRRVTTETKGVCVS